MAASKKITIDIVSDTVCPFCYLGKKRLDEAIEQYKGKAEFEVNWHPFQLNPDAPKEGVPKLGYYYQKFGPRTDSIVENMKNNFKQQGLAPYNTDGMIANTLDSHRVSTWALKEHGWQAQNRLMDELMKGYFTEAKNYGDRSFLLEAVSKAGLDAEAARAYLENEAAGAADVAAGLERAARARITGVPAFTVNDKFKLSGAQPTEVFAELFEDILTKA
eukprot:CAMPEP_0202866936 /NCGR_PEP_ID=MMETSP1391-20130828/8440_1 /ASSEMBLY_ACC=CAM_ASM_000867 /TAXON_ID=1034604 /ORGANISM="Chlamydomonas leiostraca, Strain SAG 11-49" /LENGTH=217 /DNA_ID=CAMNT_0049546927 /DNA_START=105 /DNA_END=758 /DNA_ORIENTATION=+